MYKPCLAEMEENPEKSSEDVNASFVMPSILHVLFNFASLQPPFLPPQLYHVSEKYLGYILVYSCPSPAYNF